MLVKGDFVIEKQGLATFMDTLAAIVAITMHDPELASIKLMSTARH